MENWHHHWGEIKRFKLFRIYIHFPCKTFPPLLYRLLFATPQMSWRWTNCSPSGLYGEMKLHWHSFFFFCDGSALHGASFFGLTPTCHCISYLKTSCFSEALYVLGGRTKDFGGNQTRPPGTLQAVQKRNSFPDPFSYHRCSNRGHHLKVDFYYYIFMGHKVNKRRAHWMRQQN